MKTTIALMITFVIVVFFVVDSQRIHTGLSREEVFKRLDILPVAGDTVRLTITDRFPSYQSERLVYVFKNDTLVGIGVWQTQEVKQEER